MKHVVCYSGGHSSALVAIEVVRKYGKDDVVLLNHDITGYVEGQDIKRFKEEVADYLGMKITYANHEKWAEVDQFTVCIDAKAFRTRSVPAICTSRLKTEPFQRWLSVNAPPGAATIYYGFDANEQVRIQRRVGVLSSMGYNSDYPLAMWERTIRSTLEIGIKPPNTYESFKHANCTGCLKAGKQHWYIVYLQRPDIFERAKMSEEVIGHSILKEAYLSEIEEDFAKMKQLGIETTEHEDGRTFFARVRKIYKEVEADDDQKPCECVF